MLGYRDVSLALHVALVLWLPMVVWGPLVTTMMMVNCVVCEAFLVHPKCTRTLPFSTHRVQTSIISQHFMMPPPTEFTVLSSECVSSLTLAGEEASWRQYFSLLLIGGVLIDIVLGSPLANMALKPLRGDNYNEQDDDDDSNKTKQSSNNSSSSDRSRERIDSDAVAKAAIERAQNALELRRFLDERKTDWDRMEDMKRKLDAEMQELDADLKAREESLKRKQSK